MRLRNPWVFFRFLLLGWYVRFTRPLSFPIHIVASLSPRSLKGREVYKSITEQSIAPPGGLLYSLSGLRGRVRLCTFVDNTFRPSDPASPDVEDLLARPSVSGP